MINRLTATKVVSGLGLRQGAATSQDPKPYRGQSKLIYVFADRCLDKQSGQIPWLKLASECFVT
jgi:hypothetical protein